MVSGSRLQRFFSFSFFGEFTHGSFSIPESLQTLLKPTNAVMFTTVDLGKQENGKEWAKALSDYCQRIAAKPPNHPSFIAFKNLFLPVMVKGSMLLVLGQSDDSLSSCNHSDTLKWVELGGRSVTSKVGLQTDTRVQNSKSCLRGEEVVLKEQKSHHPQPCIKQSHLDKKQPLSNQQHGALCSWMIAIKEKGGRQNSCQFSLSFFSLSITKGTDARICKETKQT